LSWLLELRKRRMDGEWIGGGLGIDVKCVQFQKEHTISPQQQTLKDYFR